MKRIITFGNHAAELYVGEYRAALYTDEKELPAELADALNEAGDIHVHNVGIMVNGFGVIGMTHDLPASELLAEVCDAITLVYDTDTTVSNACP